MKLTKQQRHMAYMIMLAEAETGEYENYGFCRIISWHLDESMYFPRDTDLRVDELPELWARRPRSFCGEYWFSTSSGGWQTRTALLKQCIEETADAWPK